VIRVLPLHEHPVDSPDYQAPHGARQDNSTNEEFVTRLLARLNPTPYVLDLGCAGGGFVESLCARGAIAIGLEGSDWPREHKAHAWGRIPEHLFCAHVGAPFVITDHGGDVLRFDAITAWEFLEHLREDELHALNVNLHAHTGRGALFIGSVNLHPDPHGDVDYHQTVRPWEWWRAFFEERGWRLRADLAERFDGCWVRGGDGSVNFVLEKR
jgi:SAM-dependent methyltransferase